ncbi:MAG: Mrp/NBP35 family ATP-binding protein [Candidatus Kapaibacterium sp.]
MSSCDNNCTECKTKNNCSKESKQVNELSKIKKIIAVGSGKGGVGKSLVTTLLATKLRKEGFNVGILDADITGPSIPKTFGINAKTINNKDGIIPIESKLGIKIVSINMFLDNESDAVIWRGPILSNTVIQFFKDTMWGSLDCLIIDMPPGTADIVLTIYQSIPIDGLIIVTTPQDLVSLIVEKSYNMAKQMGIKTLGLVENMSYLKCDKCENRINIFGESKIDDLAIKLETKVIEKIPLDTKLSKYVDDGNIENYENTLFKDFNLERK